MDVVDISHSCNIVRNVVNGSGSEKRDCRHKTFKALNAKIMSFLIIFAVSNLIFYIGKHILHKALHAGRLNLENSLSITRSNISIYLRVKHRNVLIVNTNIIRCILQNRHITKTKEVKLNTSILFNFILLESCRIGRITIGIFKKNLGNVVCNRILCNNNTTCMLRYISGNTLNCLSNTYDFTNFFIIIIKILHHRRLSQSSIKCHMGFSRNCICNLLSKSKRNVKRSAYVLYSHLCCKSSKRNNTGYMILTVFL